MWGFDSLVPSQWPATAPDPITSHRFRYEHRDLPRGAGLILGVWRESGDARRPEALALRFVRYFSNPHLLDLFAVADFDIRVGTQVVDPNGVFRRSSHGADKHVRSAILHAHQRGLAGISRLVAGVRHDDHRQPGVAQS